MAAEDQDGLFGNDDDFDRAREHWKGMPEFVQEDLQPYASILVHFESAEARAAFEERIGQKLPAYTKRTPSIWYPKAAIGSFADKRYRAVEEDPT